MLNFQNKGLIPEQQKDKMKESINKVRTGTWPRSNIVARFKP